MKFTTTTEEMKKAFAFVSKSIAARTTTLEVLMGVLITAKHGLVSLRGTNLDTHAVMIVPDAVIEEEGEVLVSGRLFKDILMSGKGQITLTTSNDKDKRLIVTSKSATQKVVTMNIQEYPVTPTLNEMSSFLLPKEFVATIPLLVNSAANDEARPMLTGVHLSWKDGKLRADASDGFRLTRFECKVSDMTEEGKCLIPRKSLSILAGIDGQITMLAKADAGKVLFMWEGGSLVSILLDSRFPAVDNIIPQKSDTCVTVDGKSAYEAWERATATSALDLTILDTETKTISARDEQAETVANLPMKVEGNAIRIGVNGKYMLDILGGLKDLEVVNIGMIGSKTPLKITTPEQPGLTCVIMPMHLPTEK